MLLHEDNDRNGAGRCPSAYVTFVGKAAIADPQSACLRFSRSPPTYGGALHKLIRLVARRPDSGLDTGQHRTAAPCQSHFHDHARRIRPPHRVEQIHGNSGSCSFCSRRNRGRHCNAGRPSEVSSLGSLIHSSTHGFCKAIIAGESALPAGSRCAGTDGRDRSPRPVGRSRRGPPREVRTQHRHETAFGKHCQSHGPSVYKPGRVSAGRDDGACLLFRRNGGRVRHRRSAVARLRSSNSLRSSGQCVRWRRCADLAGEMRGVRREGQVRLIPADELVPGDIVLLDAGDAVSADLRLIDGSENAPQTNRC